MDTAFSKFIEYLKNYISELSRIEKENNLKNASVEEILNNNKLKFKISDGSEIYSVIVLLSQVKNRNSRAYFNNFDLMSTYFIKSPLTIDEYFEIISFYISKNIDLGIFDIDGCEVFDINSIYDANLKSIRKNDIKAAIRSFLIDEMNKNNPSIINDIDESDKNRMVLNEEQKRELLKFVQEHTRDTSNFTMGHKIFKEFYLDKISNIDQSDISKICTALYLIDVDKIIIGKIKYMLERRVNRGNNNSISDNLIKSLKPKVNPNVLTDTEYKKIRRILSQYFDFYNVKVIRELTNDEILYCIKLLVRIDAPTMEISRFVEFTKMDDALYNEK